MRIAILTAVFFFASVVQSLANLGPRVDVETAMAQSFSQMEIPYFPSYGIMDDLRQMENLFDGFSLKQSVLEKLQSDVSEMSSGQVRLEIGDPNEFNIRVRGAAEYLILVRGPERMRVIISTGYPTVQLDGK